MRFALANPTDSKFAGYMDVTASDPTELRAEIARLQNALDERTEQWRLVLRELSETEAMLDQVRAARGKGPTSPPPPPPKIGSSR